MIIIMEAKKRGIKEDLFCEKRRLIARKIV